MTTAIVDDPTPGLGNAELPLTPPIAKAAHHFQETNPNLPKPFDSVVQDKQLLFTDLDDHF